MKLAIVCDYYVFLGKLLTALEKRFSIIDVDVFEDLKAYKQSKRYYDVLVIDLDLLGRSGIFDTESNPLSFPYIIYMASDEKFKSEAFDVNVLGYVLKENFETKLLDKLDKARKLIMMHKIYIFKSDRQTLRVPEDKIVYFYIKDGFIYMVLETKRLVRLSYRTLMEVEDQLSSRFWRINRNCIVNQDKIVFIDQHTHNVKLIDGSMLHVSRREWKQHKILD